jgi:hypothetical protein
MRVIQWHVPRTFALLSVHIFNSIKTLKVAGVMGVLVLMLVMVVQPLMTHGGCSEAIGGWRQEERVMEVMEWVR